MSTHDNRRICAKSMVLFIHASNSVLLYKGDRGSGVFYRPPGGHIEYGEYAIDAAVREIQEEMNIDIYSPVFIGVYENIFTYSDNKTNHEYIFLYRAKDSDIAKIPTAPLMCEGNTAVPLVWVPREDIRKGIVNVVPFSVRDYLVL